MEVHGQKDNSFAGSFKEGQPITGCRASYDDELYPLIIIIFFNVLLPICRESIVLGSNFESGDFDGCTRFEVS